MDFGESMKNCFEKIDYLLNSKAIELLASSYSIISLIYRDLFNLKKALEFQLKANEISEKVLDAGHSDLATSYNNLSLIYRDSFYLSLK